ncbi:MAG TPA: SPOR domain-containing protein [Thiothrix sp.]|nr:SPOR domain-containing protein [Thiothrix sp.]
MYFYNTYKVPLPEDNPDNAQTAQTPTSNPPREGKQPKLNDLGFEETDPISVVIDNSRKEQTEKKRAIFSYYAVLPNLELDVTVQPSEHDTQELPQTTTTVTEKLILKPGSYILQLASFRTIAQANQAQSHLSKKSLETHIEKKVIRGKTWYRLFMGPTEDESTLSSWKTAIVQVGGYQPIAVKIKQH